MLARDGAQLTEAWPRRITHPRRGDIWLVDFDPTLGAEIQKTRPALVIQNDVENRVSPIAMITKRAR